MPFGLIIDYELREFKASFDLVYHDGTGRLRDIKRRVLLWIGWCDDWHQMASVARIQLDFILFNDIA
jgi:hypothetical protein